MATPDSTSIIPTVTHRTSRIPGFAAKQIPASSAMHVGAISFKNCGMVIDLTLFFISNLPFS
jgi:hypothetical protein